MRKRKKIIRKIPGENGKKYCTILREKTMQLLIKKILTR